MKGNHDDTSTTIAAIDALKSDLGSAVSGSGSAFGSNSGKGAFGGHNREDSGAGSKF